MIIKILWLILGLMLGIKLGQIIVLTVVLFCSKDTFTKLLARVISARMNMRKNKQKGEDNE